MLRTVARIEGRRLASWIAAGSALLAGWQLSAGGPPRGGCLAAAIASGGLLAVAAIGRVPTGVLAGRAGPALAVAGLRLSWPLAGVVAGAAAAAAGGPAAVLAAPGLALASVVAHAGLFAVLLRSPRTQEAVASLTLAIAGGAAAAAAIAAASGAGALLETLAASATWGMLVAAVGVSRAGGGPEWLGIGPPIDHHRGSEPAPAVVMASALAGMMLCFFLTPRLAWGYAVLAIGWLICLTVPPVTGGSHAAARRLVRGAAGRPPLPGSLSAAVRLAARWAAILAWPAVVAAVLPASDGQRGWWPLATLAGLGLAVAVLVPVAAATAAGRIGGETARATLLALAVLAASVAATSKPPKSPGLPAFFRPAAAPPAGTGVEPWRGSCKTPQPTQPPGSSRPAQGFVEIRFPRAR